MGQSCVLVEWKGALHEKLKLLNKKLRRSELFGKAWVHLLAVSALLFWL